MVTQVGTPNAPVISSGTNTPSSSPTFSGTQTLTIGDLLVALVANWGGTTGGVPTTATTGWSQALEFEESSTHAVVAAWTKTAVGSDTAPTFTATNTGTVTYSTLAAQLFELNGQASSPVVASGTLGGTTANPVSPVTSGNVPSTLCYALSSIMIAISAAATDTMSVGGSWSGTPSGNNASVSTRTHFAFNQYAAPPSGSTLTCSETYTGTGSETAGLVIVFGPAPASSAPHRLTSQYGAFF